MSSDHTWTRRRFTRAGGLFTASLLVASVRQSAHAETGTETGLVDGTLDVSVNESGFTLVFALRNTTDSALGLLKQEGIPFSRGLVVALAVEDARWDVDVVREPNESGPVSRGIRYIEVPIASGQSFTVASVQCVWPEALIAAKERLAGAQATVHVTLKVDLAVPTSRSPVQDVAVSSEAALTLPSVEQLSL